MGQRGGAGTARQRLGAALCLCALVGALFSALFTGMGPAVAATQQDAERQLQEVTKQLNALDVWLDDAGRRLAAEQRQLAAADRSIEAAARRARTLREGVRRGEAALAELGAEREGLQQRRQGQAERVATHLRHAWRFGNRDYLKMFLDQQEPLQFERRTRYHRAIAEASAEAISAFRDTLQALAANEQRLRAEQSEAERAQAALQEQRAVLLDEREQRRRMIADLQTDVADKNRQREKLEADQRRLQALVDELQRAKARAERVADAAPAGAGLGTGGLPWPVEGQVQRRFGQARAGGRMKWQGMLIQAPLGADVRAVAAGTVVFADWLRGFGLLAVVDHGDDHMSLYGYADALYKRAGERVEGGETIAAAGQSGGQQDVGLYFEIRRKGQPIDPRDWLQSRTAENRGQ